LIWFFVPVKEDLVGVVILGKNQYPQAA